MARSCSLRRCLALFATIVLAALAAVAVAAPAQAASSTRYVANSGDDTDNDCTDSNNPCQHIQYAVDQADAGDTVSIATGTYPESVRVRESLTLVGAGASGSGKSTIDGDGDPSIFVDGFDTSTPPVVTIKQLNVSDNSDADGVLVEDAEAHVVNCVVSNNNNAGIDVEDDSTVTVADSTVSSNGSQGVLLNSEPVADRTATASQDSLLPQIAVTDSAVNANGNGGVDVEQGDADVTSSTLDSNVGAGMVLDGTGTEGSLTRSTVSNTAPTSIGEGGEAFGGGVLVFPSGSVDIDTSTIFGNTAQGVLSFLGNVTISNSTISGTAPPTGTDGNPEDLPYGGVAVDDERPTLAHAGMAAFRGTPAVARAKLSAVSAAPETPSVTVTGSIVADNTSLADCNGDVVDGGYNLDSDGSCAWSASGSISNGAAKLAPLQDNGGPTKTLYLAKTSDAIDRIPSGSANCGSDNPDQRGVGRPQGTKCDIGAVEDDQPSIVFSPAQLPDGTVGVAYHAQITATGGLGAPYEFSLAPNSKPLPTGLTLHANGKIDGTPGHAGHFPITVSVDDPTLHNFVIVIAGPASSTTPPPPSSSSPAPSSSSGGELANTGAGVAPLGATGLLAILAGVLLVLAGWTRTRPGRHRGH
jgi:parallel beta-helix repeat protein